MRKGIDVNDMSKKQGKSTPNRWHEKPNIPIINDKHILTMIFIPVELNIFVIISININRMYVSKSDNKNHIGILMNCQ